MLGLHSLRLEESGFPVQKTDYSLGNKNRTQAGQNMRIVYHLGAHFTDDERLLRCMQKNRDLLIQHDIVVPNPKRYRTLLRETATKLKGRAATVDEQALILEQIMEEDHASRLILSWESFLSLPPYVLKDKIYPTAAERIQAFCQIFPEIEPEFHLAIRNPASFLPLLYDRLKPDSYTSFLNGVDPQEIYWSEVIDRILHLNPHVPMTIWCDEDTPLIWPEVLRAVTGLPAATPLQGDDDLLSSLMSGEGMTRMNAYLQSHPPQHPSQRRKIVSAFLDKFALPERINQDITLPGWTAQTISDLTRRYEEDVARIAHRPDITFLSP